jgi:hypothetical protein
VCEQEGRESSASEGVNGERVRVDAVAVVVVVRKKRARPLSGRSGPQATRGTPPVPHFRIRLNAGRAGSWPLVQMDLRIHNTIRIQTQAPAHAPTVPESRAAELDDELQRGVLQQRSALPRRTVPNKRAPSTHDAMAARQLWLLLVLVLQDPPAPPSAPRSHTPRVRWAGMAPRRTHRMDLSSPPYDCPGSSFKLRMNACTPHQRLPGRARARNERT